MNSRQAHGALRRYAASKSLKIVGKVRRYGTLEHFSLCADASSDGTYRDGTVALQIHGHPNSEPEYNYVDYRIHPPVAGRE